MPTKARAILVTFALALSSVAHPQSAAQPERVVAAAAAPAVHYNQPPLPKATTTIPQPPTTTTTTTQPAPVPTSPPPPTQPPASEAQGAVPDMIRTIFAPYGPEAVRRALSVARCESGYNPAAQNPSGASGVFQVMPVHAESYANVTGLPYYDGRFDPWANVTFAAWLAYEAPGGGWQHWRGACA